MQTERRAIRSFVTREGRMTNGQRRALESAWCDYGVDLVSSPLSLDHLFAAKQPVTCEIGFGMGDSLFEMAQQNPKRNFIGIEVHRPGVGHLLSRAEEAKLTNLKVFNDDSIDVLTRAIPERGLDIIQIFFPDPWHKKKHHKRRLINADFAALLASRIKPGGIIHIATDWLPYAEWIEEVFEGWQSVSPPKRPETKYERRGKRLEHTVTDLAYLVDEQ